MVIVFPLCLAHGYLPPAIIETTIVPIVKNKSGNLSDSSNYRPIDLLQLCPKCLSLFYYLNVQNIYLLLTINLVSNNHTVLTYAFIP